MREIQYKDFSLSIHKKNWVLERPNVCEFELTFGCALHCRHCYSDCYNKTSYIRNELDTHKVKFILDKLYRRGVVWLGFTGGDPLNRTDFLELYSYARNKGFMITVFTNGYSMTKKIASYFKKSPPFALEITLNAVAKDLYEEIAGVKNSFDKVAYGINLILKAKLPLKVKTQVSRDNINALPYIKKFIKKLGLGFNPNIFIYARLNGDLTPCNLRISPRDVLRIERKKSVTDDDCEREHSEIIKPGNNGNLFKCTIAAGDGIRIDPYGNIIPCICIREPAVSLFKKEIEVAQKEILDWIKTKRFTQNTECSNCLIRESCSNCPGKSWLENGNLETKIDWSCELAHLIAK